MPTDFSDSFRGEDFGQLQCVHVCTFLHVCVHAIWLCVAYGCCVGTAVSTHGHAGCVRMSLYVYVSFMFVFVFMLSLAEICLSSCEPFLSRCFPFLLRVVLWAHSSVRLSASNLSSFSTLVWSNVLDTTLTCAAATQTCLIEFAIVRALLHHTVASCASAWDGVQRPGSWRGMWPMRCCDAGVLPSPSPGCANCQFPCLTWWCQCIAWRGSANALRWLSPTRLCAMTRILGGHAWVSPCGLAHTGYFYAGQLANLVQPDMYITWFLYTSQFYTTLTWMTQASLIL